ncbi:MAG: MurR/RpiR family transcriptional regulator [Thermodesulfobacteriota bacterium]
MPNTRPESLIKIENSLRSLKEAEKKAAEFILANAQRVVDMTISDVAQESGVSESTVFRLCRALDFPGFRAFKMDLARQGAVSLERPYEPVSADDDAEAIAHKVITITVESLQETLQILDYKELELAYQALKKARKVLVLALSVSRTTAIFAADKFNFAGLDARAEIDVHFQAMRAATLGQGDVLIAFSRSGDTRDLIEAVQVAKKAGATTIGVVNNPRSFFAKLVDVRLVTKSKETRFRNDLLASRIEHLAVVDVLFTMLAAREPERAARHYRPMHDAALSKQY